MFKNFHEAASKFVKEFDVREKKDFDELKELQESMKQISSGLRRIYYFMEILDPEAEQIAKDMEAAFGVLAFEIEKRLSHFRMTRGWE